MSDPLMLGRYLLLRPLAEGGMSRLYLARLSGQAGEVVVKVLHAHLIQNAKARKDFQREIHVLSSIKHPNAVSFIDASLDEPKGPYLVMEYVRGVTLESAMAGHTRFTLRRTGNLLTQLCDLLTIVHGQGIVHRDLKPGNLMLLHAGTPHERLKVVDFGLAKLSTALYIAPEEVDDSREHPVFGTPRYVCPEQARGEEMDHRGDLYSVGVILFEMLTGQRPFRRNSVEKMLEAHDRDKPMSFADVGVRDGIPRGVEALVQECLAKSPTARPQSAAELSRRFQEALGHSSAVSAPASLTATPPAGQMPIQVNSGTTLERNDPHAVVFHMEVTMPEAIALAKLRGFIHDLKGEIVESVPGMIRVHVPESSSAQPSVKGSVLSWLGATPAPPPPTRLTEMRLHMEKQQGGRAGALALKLVLRQKGQRDANRAHFRARCERIHRDLHAYLMRC